MFENLFKKIRSGKKIVFIVEDNEAYAKTLQAFLQSRFPEIDEIKLFNIGEMCLMEMHRNPGIVIMDYVLNSAFESAHNGIEVIKRIKAQRPQTNIILLSAQEKFDVIIESVKEYDCAYVQKGNDAFSQLELLIKQIFDRKNAPTLDPWS